ncbi:pseudouridine synthase [Bradyrhizobium lablabi]|uniref:pseudouridine synthase n=1 Tax=Bradyrhizobium lablabi TaxID=722472 RepID=UPI001BA60B45|nr:pseudouridine synthase [Bradyrhizobium lablabi]MBR1126283.1 pseudouridine synthase [Bradyrhizobium lablabi]
MPRDTDKNNDSRGRRDRPGGGRPGGKPGGKGRSGAARGPEKKFAKRGFGKGEGDKRSFGDREGRPPRRREDSDAPRRDYGDRPRTPRFDRDDRGRGEKRDFKPRGDRPRFDREDRAPRGEGRFRDRDDARPAGRFGDRKFGDRKPYASRDRDGEKRPYTPRGERSSRDGDRPPRKFGGDRGPRKDFGDRPPHGESKPWQKREGGDRDERPARSFDKPRFNRSRDDRGDGERPRFSRSREDRVQGDRSSRERPNADRESDRRDRGDRPRGDRPDRPRFDRDREDRPKFDRPRQRRDDREDRPRRERPEGRTDWQEHPRSDRRDRFADRPRRDNEDDSKIFAKRPAFGGRGAYRERNRDDDRRSSRREVEEKPKKAGERIAKVLARAGLASRRDAEEMVTQGRVTVNGRLINSPALDITANDVVAVDGKPLPPRERTRLWMYHKPRGLMTTHDDPEGRPTVFDNLPEGLPRLISVGRLDFNTEGLLLLTNDGGLARILELPDTGWLRRYRVRAHGEVTQAQLDELKKGVEVDGVKYGSIDATLERDQGANVWLVFAIREGKNREVRNVMAHLGLEVNRLIRISYGPFQLGELEEGKVEEVKTRVLREQLGEKVAKLAGADFARPEQSEADEDEAPRAKKPYKASGKNAIVSDGKGRRVLVQRTGSEEARIRNEEENAAYGPPRRVKRGYHGKRDLKPRDE